jgi:serine/threonine protein kinase
MDVTRDKAHAAWQQQYSGVRMLELGRNDVTPFTPGTVLGSTNISKVHSLEFGGAVIALKIINIRKRKHTRPSVESNILEIIRKRRHIHLVELVGSYLQSKNRHLDELGLLIWPCAQMDLSLLLDDMDYVQALESRLEIDGSNERPQGDELDALGDLAVLTASPWTNDKAVTLSAVSQIQAAAVKLLYGYIGCLAHAVQHIHDVLKIRHRDLKPGQVLVSRYGLWLTDFGRSEDFSRLNNSKTDGGDLSMTLKYDAPERKLGQGCSRPEDIFALGCTYLETSYRLSSLTAQEYLDPEDRTSWTYHENLNNSARWLVPLKRHESAQTTYLASLIDRMMSQNPDDRPKIADIIENLKHSSTDEVDFFGSCCSESRFSWKEQSLIVRHEVLTDHRTTPKAPRDSGRTYTRCRSKSVSSHLWYPACATRTSRPTTHNHEAAVRSGRIWNCG